MRLSKAIEGFLIARAADGYSPDTLQIFRTHFKQLATFLGDDVDVAAITQAQLSGFLHWLRTEYRPANNHKGPLSDKTVNNAWTFLRSFFGWLHGEGLIDARPDLSLPEPEYATPAILPFTRDDVVRLLKAAEYMQSGEQSWRRRTADRDRAIILTLLDTGLRAGELVRLRVEDVNLENGEIYIRTFRRGKKTRSRVVYVERTARRALWRYLAGREDKRPDDLFFLTDTDREMTRKTLLKMLYKVAARAGVANCFPHRFRHTFAIEFLRNGGDPFRLQLLLGHSDMAMTRRYVAFVRADVADAHRRASPADRWRL
jgi:integrase/recombinase XerD